MAGELLRQFVHIFTGIIIILIIYISGPSAPSVLSLLLAAAVLLTMILTRSPILEKAPSLFRRLARDGKQKIKLKGTILLLSGVLVVLFIFPRNIVYASVAIVTLGDSVATIVGTSAGKHRLPYSEMKTLEGTLGGLVAAFTGALFFVDPIPAFSGSAGGMFLESLISLQTIRSESMKGIIRFFMNDNFLIPVFSSLIMLYVSA
ncbi:MAG: hypothetical protein JW705_07220 [Methanosarcinaceae archaeon]|nr:hypothetical protein [Methanosarcinaceae archaeon]